MVQKIINLYSFNELIEDAKQKAINNLSDINVDYNWWKSIYEDAKTIGLKITSFDLDRNRHCKGEFTLSAREVAEKIISEHGESCNTYKTAYKFIEDADGIEEELPIKMDDEEGEEIDYDFNEDERDMQLHELECKFLKSLLEDYSMILLLKNTLMV